MAELLQILDFSPTSRPAIQLMWILKITALARRLPVVLEPSQAGRKDGSRMCENGFCKLLSAEEKDNRPWPDTSGGQVYIWARERRKGRLWDAPKGLIVGEKKHKVGL